MVAATDTTLPSIRTPLTVLALLYAAFVACLAWTAAGLPERMATHFDFDGQPNDWMSRESYLVFMAVFGLLFPLLMPGAALLLRVLPLSLINIPNREYWLAPQRRVRTTGDIFFHSLWFACLVSAFVLGLHVLVVEANRAVPPNLSNAAIWTLAGCWPASCCGPECSCVTFACRHGLLVLEPKKRYLHCGIQAATSTAGNRAVG